MAPFQDLAFLCCLGINIALFYVFVQFVLPETPTSSARVAYGKKSNEHVYTADDYLGILSSVQTYKKLRAKKQKNKRRVYRWEC
jgi:hypothetical protein